MNEKLLKKNSRSETYDLGDAIKKVFMQPKYLDNCKKANLLFKDFPWAPQVVDEGNNYIVYEKFNEQDRLDKLLPSLKEEAREKIVIDILEAILEMYIEGYCHRDIHTKNVFIKDGRIKIIDYEYIKEHNDIPFLESYDLTGRNLSSPCSARNMCFSKEEEWAIGKSLGFDLERVIKGLVFLLEIDLYGHSEKFKSKNGYHKRSKGDTYASFHTKYFDIPIERAQRDTAKRLKKFGVSPKTISGRSVLDLGCNFGAVGFEIEKYKPKSYTGLEYIKEQVAIANKIASIEGLTNYRFYQDDLNDTTFFGKKYDTVFCLSINKHVASEYNLFVMLGKITNKTLYFEGNAETAINETKRLLSQAGFDTIEYLGFCDDDIKASNNNRPMFVAKK